MYDPLTPRFPKLVIDSKASLIHHRKNTHTQTLYMKLVIRYVIRPTLSLRTDPEWNPLLSPPPEASSKSTKKGFVIVKVSHPINLMLSIVTTLTLSSRVPTVQTPIPPVEGRKLFLVSIKTYIYSFISTFKTLEIKKTIVLHLINSNHFSDFSLYQILNSRDWDVSRPGPNLVLRL